MLLGYSVYLNKKYPVYIIAISEGFVTFLLQNSFSHAKSYFEFLSFSTFLYRAQTLKEGIEFQQFHPEA
jgi:hypothetical protein